MNVQQGLRRSAMMGTMAMASSRVSMRLKVPLAIHHRSALKRVSSRTKSTSKVAEEPNIFRSALMWYSHKLDISPIATKCLSAGLVSGVGNIGAQRLMQHNTESRFVVDWEQTGRFALLNVVFVAPVLHYWYSWLARAVPGKAIFPVSKRVFYDEFVFTPFYVPALMGLLWTMEGVEPKLLPKMIKEEWFNIMLFDWAVYIPFQFFNFRYVPVKYQVLAINVMGVGWNTFVSWRAQTQQQLKYTAE